MPPLPNTAQAAFVDASESSLQCEPPPRSQLPSATATTAPEWEWRELEGRSIKFDLSKQQQRVRTDLKTFTQVRLRAFGGPASQFSQTNHFKSLHTLAWPPGLSASCPWICTVNI
jgi:hypothetical protein